MSVVDPVLEAYAASVSSPESPALTKLAAETRATIMSPGMMVGHLEGRFLEMLVWTIQPRLVLELGTFTGYSAMAMAACLPPGGRIITCEVSWRHAEVARRHIEASGFDERIDIRVGAALDTVATLDGPFDLVFVDADKANYLAYYEAILPKLSERGLIAIDNTLWSGSVADANDTSESATALREFNAHVVSDPRVVCVLCTMRDGITLVRRSTES